MREEMHSYVMKRFYIFSHQLLQSTSISLKGKENQSLKFIIG